MPAYSAGEHNALQVATARYEVLDLIAVGDAGYILLDDGTVIEIGGDVVAGGAGQLDSAGVGRVIRPRADKSRQERMMHVDDRRRVPGNEGVGKNLHVAGKDDQFDVQLIQKSQLARFSLGTYSRRDRNVLEGDLVEGGQRLGVAMIGDDDGNFAGQLAGADAVEQIRKAVEILRAEERHAWPLTAAAQLPAHLEF